MCIRDSSNIINACGSAALPTLAITVIEDLFPQEKAALAQGFFFIQLRTKNKTNDCFFFYLVQESIMLLVESVLV